MAQLFLMSRDGDSKLDEIVDGIRSSMKADIFCLPVFHFRNGRISFTNSTEPTSIIAQRCRSHLKRLKHWTILDSDSAIGEDDADWRNIPRYGEIYPDEEGWEDEEEYEDDDEEDKEHKEHKI